MQIHVSVTQTEISVGKVQTYSYCPVALAVNRAYALRGVQEKAMVGAGLLRGEEVAYLLTADGKVTRLPVEVGRWVDLYDAGCAMSPIAFDVDLPLGEG